MATSTFARALVLLMAFAMLLMTGCASNPRNPEDPLEGYNRAMFSFNEGVDKAVVKPVARVYEAAVPQLVRTGIGNVFGNLGDVWVGLNNLLQGEVGDGMSSGRTTASRTVRGPRNGTTKYAPSPTPHTARV
jgi:phospholipid-binding lipoprotein MlaA